MAQSEIPVAWIGLGGMLAGAVATAAASRFMGRASIKAATIAGVDSLQDELSRFTDPFVQAGDQLRPAVSGRTPSGEWHDIAPTLPRTAPKWCLMVDQPIKLLEMPGIIRRQAAGVDAEIVSHQAISAPRLAPHVHAAARDLHRQMRELINEFASEFKGLVKRGMGVM